MDAMLKIVHLNFLHHESAPPTVVTIAENAASADEMI